MKDNLIKRMMTKDGDERVSFFFDEHADSPRDLTDEPLHCEDWSRDCSIMNKQERENKSEDARKLLEYLILTGDNCNREKFINALIDNGKKIGKEHVEFGSALVYDRSRRGYILYETSSHYWSTRAENGWYENEFYDGKKDDIDLCTIIGDVRDETIDWCAQNCLTDKVKIMSYGFGYNGEISFSHDVDTNAEGIAWIDKKEFMERNGLSEKEWAAKGCYDHVKWLIDELEAWSSGDCYCFVVEKAIKSKVHKTYINVEREDETFEEVEWELEDSCGGFYGDYDKQQEWMLETAGIKVEDLIEIKAA